MITFREVNDDLPDGWLPALHWYVEFWPDDFEPSYPWGTAYVVISPMTQVIEYLCVQDQHRRKGIATRLVEACEQRWPAIVTTDAISEPGEAFLRKLEA